MAREYAVINLPTSLEMAGLSFVDKPDKTKRVISSSESGFSQTITSSVTKVTQQSAANTVDLWYPPENNMTLEQ